MAREYGPVPGSGQPEVPTPVNYPENTTGVTPKIASETVVFDSNDEVGSPDFSAITKRVERERQVKLDTIHILLNKIKPAKLNDIYYRGQSRQFGFMLPLDPSRINGEAIPVPVELPKRENFYSNKDYERAKSDFADALASQEKHTLSGVPFS